jgi:hypothetical protein
MKHLAAFSVLMFASLGLSGQQQQTKTSVDNDGTKEVIDSTNGWTVTEKNGGTVTHKSAAEMTTFCGKLDDDFAVLEALRDNIGVKQICDEWGQIQPRTRIERMPFSRLMTRLLVIAPPSTDFARYRGIELKSDADSKAYDAIILPNDIADASCTIEERNRHAEGMLYIYKCDVKTPSFPAAIKLKDKLVQALTNFDLSEDEVREHGLAAHARDSGFCAPGGECLEGHIYVTAIKDWKTLQIEADPDFTRDTRSEVRAMANGTHAPINGIAANSASVSFQVFSVGPLKTDVMGHAESPAP